MSALKDVLPSTSNESATIFSTLPAPFTVLTHIKNEKIKTREFLDASAGVVTIVGKFGKVFSPVTNDMNGNIKKISAKYEEDIVRYEFLEDMILQQKNSGDIKVVEALQWLRRALHFIMRFFQLIIADSDNNNHSQDLSPFIKSAYQETLQKYHGWLTSQLFNILSRTIPNRRQLFYTFALDQYDKDEHVLKTMKSYTQNMLICVQKLVDFYEEHDLETNEKV